MRLLKVGELARRAGLTVRALHHYDEIGLLTPSQRSAAGYRLYGEEDVARLTQVVLLRQLGLPLEEIRACLADPGQSLERTVGLHVDRLRRQIDQRQRLLARLESLAERLGRTGKAPVEELTQTLEMIAMYERHFTAEQLKTLEERRAAVGEERIAQAESEWPELIAQVRAAMERGDDPASEPVQALARRWQALVHEFTGGDPGLAESVRGLYRSEPALRERTGLDPGILEYVARASPRDVE